jgi:hypothetical protein
MFKLKITHDNGYSEMGQPNPLRWRIMHKRGDTLFSQSGLIKCKDFFNDVVAWRVAKQSFMMYRFNNQVKFNREGLYLHLTGISDYSLFWDNFDYVNARLKQDLGVEVSVHNSDSSSAIICIPHKVWKSTYYISALSLLIRACNYKCSYEDWESFFKDTAPLKTVDGAVNYKARKYIAKHGFKLPVKFRKLWYRCMGHYNSEDSPQASPSIVHNNGVNDWVNNMGAK